MPSLSIEQVAGALDVPADRVQAIIHATIGALPQTRYYVFRITQAQQEQRVASGPRTIAAFPTPDDALAYAQRNRFGPNVQIRPVEAAHLVLYALSDATVKTVVFADGETPAAMRGIGPGLRITRERLLEQINGASAAPPELVAVELSAAAYDSLQFGVNFVRRAEFRVALAQAIEHLVAGYEPPPGSVDQGQRSIFAIGEVELWLRRNGFPHAYQRRWIDVADDPQWQGASELCEIDAGTKNRLVVCLAISEDATGRQFIRDVRVVV